MNSLKSTKQIILSHTLTYFNFLNLVLAGLVILSGQYKNMLFMGVVIANTLIGIVQELRVKKVIDRLSVITATKAHRRTKNGLEEIPVEEIRVGDELYFAAGDQITADCSVLSSDGLEINESMLTGESVPVVKKAGDTLLSGTFVTAGSGYATARQTGPDNYAAKLVEKARTKRRATSEMQNTINRIIRLVSYAILPIGIALFCIQYYRSGSTLSAALVGTVAGVLGMIPEGLVLLTSISFTLGVGRLARKKALVQEMESIEALARVNVLCLDKTGTITTGNLTVEEVLPLTPYADESVENLLGALIYAFDETNATSQALRRYFAPNPSYRILEKIPFSSARKFMGVSIEDAGCFVLGAPDFLSQDLTLLRKTEDYGAKGYRVLLLASCDKLASDAKQLTNVKPYALLLLSDEIKSDAKDTFTFFESQGVAVKILSGDNAATASTIGQRAGIRGAEHYVDATTLPDDFHELVSIVPNYTVFGRVSPEKKNAIVKAFQENDKIVGMVGDGVNDVLALKDADCGIAMAKGADAARQAAHIVLMDSEFSSMKNIVKEGRTIIANIERVSALYLTKTLYSVLLCLLFTCLGHKYPFIPIQLTLIGAVAIGIPSFVLTLEQNNKVTTGSFSRHVLRISLPAAVILTASLLCVQFLSGPLGLSSAARQTCNLLLGGIVSLGVVLVVCHPLKKRHLVLFVLLCTIFVAAILIMPEFFGILPLKALFK